MRHAVLCDSVVSSLLAVFVFFFKDTATTAIDTSCHTLSLHYALPIVLRGQGAVVRRLDPGALLALADGMPHDAVLGDPRAVALLPDLRVAHRLDQIVEVRSEEHTSELQSLMRISYAVFC